MLSSLPRQLQGFAGWIPRLANYSDYFLRPDIDCVVTGVTPPRPAESLWKKTDPIRSPQPLDGKPTVSTVSRLVFLLVRQLGRSLV